MAIQTESERATGWVGWIFFASLMMMLEGGFQLIVGLVALFNKNFYVTTAHHIAVFNIATWGWINLIIGIITILAGLELMRGAFWARSIAILLASLSLLSNMAFLPAYPIWSIIIGLTDILVIYAVAVHGNELRP